MNPKASVVILALILTPLSPVVAQDIDLARLVQQLCDDSNTQGRHAAYQTLQQDRSPAILPLLETHLPTAPLQSQSLGINLLQGHPRDASHPVLRRLTKTKAPFLQLSAAAVLVRAGDTTMAEVIVQALHDKSTASLARIMMLGQLHGIREPRVVTALRAMAVHTTDLNVFDGALFQLLVTDEKTTAAHVALQLADDTLPPGHRASLAAVAMALGDPKHSTAVVEEITARGALAVNRLHRFLLRAPRLTPQVLEAIVATLDPEDTSGQGFNGLALLGQHGGGKEVALVRRFLHHKTPYVARAALSALQKLTGGLQRDELGRLLESAEAELVLMAADTLRRMDDLAGLRHVIKLLGTEGSHRAEAASTLARFRHPDAVAPLIQALEDSSQEVRVAAVQGLGPTLHSLFPYRRFDLASTGYEATGPEVVRSAAVARIRAWWERHRPK